MAAPTATACTAAPEAEIYLPWSAIRTECWGAYLAAGIYAAIDDSMNINLSLAGRPRLEGSDRRRSGPQHSRGVRGRQHSPPYSWGSRGVPGVLSVGAISRASSHGLFAHWFNTATTFARGGRGRRRGGGLAAMKTGCWIWRAARACPRRSSPVWRPSLNGSAATTRTRISRGANTSLYVAGDDSLTASGFRHDARPDGHRDGRRRVDAEPERITPVENGTADLHDQRGRLFLHRGRR
jgi:hypothetical protein